MLPDFPDQDDTPRAKEWRITIWTEYASIHIVGDPDGEPMTEEEAMKSLEEDQADTEIDTYYGDTISTEAEAYDG